MNEALTLSSPPPVNPPPKEDPPVVLATAEDMEKYAQLMGWLYQEIHPSDHKKIRFANKFYRVVHLFPEFTGIMETEFVAKILVEQFIKVPGPNGKEELTKVERSFMMRPEEFEQKYRPAEPYAPPALKNSTL